jgi:hypothetical protein
MSSKYIEQSYLTKHSKKLTIAAARVYSINRFTSKPNRKDMTSKIIINMLN